MDYIRKCYGVPAKRGGSIRFDGKDDGVILGADNGRLRVRFDGPFKLVLRLHPTWRVEYL